MVKLNQLIERLCDADIDFVDNPEPGVPLKNLYLETDLGPVDLLGMIKGLERKNRRRWNQSPDLQ